jgi:hypothetical protein
MQKVGESEDYAATSRLPPCGSNAVQLDALQVTARPISGAGARAAFTTAMQSWQAGGTLIDLHKEGMGALLPLRVLLFFCGCVAFFTLLKLWKGRLRWFIGDCRERLRLEYAMKLMPRLLAGMLLMALSCCILAFGAAALINYIVAPVYTFPEWVPTVLVEWDDITAAFWQVWQGAAGMMELRSPELIRIRYFAMLTAWCSAAAAWRDEPVDAMAHEACGQRNLKDTKRTTVRVAFLSIAVAPGGHPSSPGSERRFLAAFRSAFGRPVSSTRRRRTRLPRACGRCGPPPSPFAPPRPHVRT